MILALKKRKVEIVLIFMLVLLFTLFLISLFKNIAYPLLWNDETETVMHGVRVLEYGYPKVHDGKNVVCPLNYPDISTWIDKKTDAYIATGWGHSYFAAPLIFLADRFSDIYAKTAILRSGFAVAGAFGLIIFALMLTSVFQEKKQKLIALNAFAILSLLSVSLALHLREVRYYSLVILLVAGLMLVFVKFELIKTLSYRAYLLLTAALSILLFNTFYPPLVILFMTICLHQFWQFLVRASNDESRVKPIAIECLKPIMPFVVSAVLLIPFLVFFRTFKVNSVIAQYLSTDTTYLEKLLDVLSFFARYDFIYLAAFLKVVLAYLVYSDKGELSLPAKQIMRFSNFLSQFFIIYVLLVAKSFYIFERYFIVLVPVMSLILILDAFSVFNFISVAGRRITRGWKVFLVSFMAAVSVWSLAGKTPSITGHIYEMFHPYKGPLDFAIPYIKERYKNTENLVIATNYEETAYMYYLGSKTIVGYVGNNLESDLDEKPDIVINRKSFGGAYDRIMNHYLSRGNFVKVTLPVYDDRVNNIPELNHKFIFHRFERVELKSETELLDIYTRNENR